MLRVVGTLVRHCADIMETVRHQLATLGYVAPKVEIAETITQGFNSKSSEQKLVRNILKR